MTCAFCGPGGSSCDHQQHDINGQPACCSCFTVALVMTRRSATFYGGLRPGNLDLIIAKVAPRQIDLSEAITVVEDPMPISDEVLLAAFNSDAIPTQGETQ